LNNHHHNLRAQRKSALVAMVSTHVAGLFFLPLMPLLLGAIASGFDATPMQLGTMATIQLSCTALGAALLSRFAALYNCRTLVLVAILTELLVNVACTLVDSTLAITLLRAVSGLSQGILLASAAATAAASTNTERIYATYNVVLAVFAVLGLLIGAKLIHQYGHIGGFSLFAAIDLLAIIFIIKGFPNFFIQTAQNERKHNQSHNSPVNLRPLLSLTLFGAALAGTQTFVERLGVEHGGSVELIGQYLAAGWCLAIFIPFLVIPLIRKWGGVTPLVVAYFFVASVALALSLTTSLPFYLIAAALFTPAAVFIEPFQFGILGAFDRSGRLAALGPAAISVGSGVGPVIAGSFIGVYGLKSIGFLACFFFLASIFVLFPLAVKAYKKKDADNCFSD